MHCRNRVAEVALVKDARVGVDSPGPLHESSGTGVLVAPLGCRFVESGKPTTTQRRWSASWKPCSGSSPTRPSRGLGRLCGGGAVLPVSSTPTDAAAHRGLPRRSHGARAGRPIRDQPADGRQDPHPQRRPRQPPRPDARPSRRGSTPVGGRSHGSASTSASRPGRCSSGCGSGASSCAAVIGGIRWRETDRHRLRRCRQSPDLQSW